MIEDVEFLILNDCITKQRPIQPVTELGEKFIHKEVNFFVNQETGEIHFPYSYSLHISLGAHSSSTSNPAMSSEQSRINQLISK